MVKEGRDKGENAAKSGVGEESLSATQAPIEGLSIWTINEGELC